MVETLDEDHPDIESAAKAALDTAMDLMRERAKFAVVGQVYETNGHGRVTPDSPEAVKVFLDVYDSDTKANAAAQELSTSTGNGDRLQTWVIPAFFQTPAAWHKDRREAFKTLQSKADEKRKAKMLKSIEDFKAEAQARADEIQAIEKAAGQSWPCPSKWVARGECRHKPTCR